MTDPPVVTGSSTSTTTPASSSSTVPASTTTTIVAGYAALAALLPTDVPSGFLLQPDRLADTGATNLAKAAQDDVAPGALQVLKQAGFVSGYQRAWADADAVNQNTLFLYQFTTAAGATQYALSKATELESVNNEPGAPISRFPVLISGAAGLRSKSANASFAAVVFSKGVYAVVAVSTGTGNVDQSAAAAALAAAQMLRLA